MKFILIGIFVFCCILIDHHLCLAQTCTGSIDLQATCVNLNTVPGFNSTTGCGPYIKSYASNVHIPFGVTASELLYVANLKVSGLSSLPVNCRIPLTEMVCQLIFQECVSVQLKSGSVVNLPKTPCRETCSRVADNCAQLFADGGRTSQDCDALGSNCLPLFAKNTTSYVDITDAESIAIPCQPPRSPIQPPTFYCKKMDQKQIPKGCHKYIDYGDVAFSTFFNESSAIAAADSAIAAFAPIPSACLLAAEEFVCRSIFPKCHIEKQGLPTTFYYGAPICRSACDQYNRQCGELFGLSGKPLTNCSAYSAQTLNSQYPEHNQVYRYGTTVMNIDCMASILTPKETPPFFNCVPWNGKPNKCAPYFNKNSRIFILDAFQLEARVNLTVDFLDQVEEVNDGCRKYATELICRSMLQECQTFDAHDLPTKYYMGRPPCHNTCHKLHKCKEELNKVALTVPNCDDVNTLISSKTYPISRNKLLIPGHDFEVQCIPSIY